MFGKKARENARLINELGVLKSANDDLTAVAKSLREEIDSCDKDNARLKVSLEKAESALAVARRGEDPETDAFYAAKFASAQAEPESEAVEDAAAPEPVAQTPAESKEAPRQVTRNTKRKR